MPKGATGGPDRFTNIFNRWLTMDWSELIKTIVMYSNAIRKIPTTAKINGILMLCNTKPASILRIWLAASRSIVVAVAGTSIVVVDMARNNSSSSRERNKQCWKIQQRSVRNEK